MDALPPNDPNRNGRNDNNDSGGKDLNDNKKDDTVSMLGNLEDSPVVVAMFLISVASWFLRTRCVC